MRKIVVCFISIFLCIVTVYALTNDFDLDLSKLSISANSSNNSTVLDSFNSKYALDTKVTSDNGALKEEITTLTKKTTYLLLGKSLETDEEYYKRHREYLDLGAYNFFPYDKEKGEYDDSYPNFLFHCTFAPPHSTAVNPVRSNGSNSCGSISIAPVSGFHAMNTRSRLSGTGVISNSAASV